MTNVVTIPLLLDDQKSMSGFEMTRFTYFTVESDPGLEDGSADNREPWMLRVNEVNMPFLLNVLSGIILASPSIGGEFNTHQQIEDTFELIESNPALYIDVDDIWLPNFLCHKHASRGSVYRISTSLFTQAMRYRSSIITQEYFGRICKEYHGQINFSPEETLAFNKWQQKQIDEAIENYKENEKMALKWNKKVKHFEFITPEHNGG